MGGYEAGEVASRSAVEAIQQSIAESRTRLLDTHPCDKDRIARARRENARGVFHSDRPAHILTVRGVGYKFTLGESA